MEFTDVMKIKERMCKYYLANHCISCPLSYRNNSKNCDCTYLIYHYPQEFEEICKKWAKENPTIRNIDKFKEVFGVKPSTNFCPFYNDDICNLRCFGCIYKHFWQKEYEEPKKE